MSEHFQTMCYASCLQKYFVSVTASAKSVSIKHAVKSVAMPNVHHFVCWFVEPRFSHTRKTGEACGLTHE